MRHFYPCYQHTRYVVEKNGYIRVLFPKDFFEDSKRLPHRDFSFL